jgi:hypothetical protein
VVIDGGLRVLIKAEHGSDGLALQESGGERSGLSN